MSEELREEERRYEEAAAVSAKTLDSRVLHDPVAVLKPRAAVTVAKEETVDRVVKRLAAERSGCALIVEDGRLVGIFTERDLLTRVLAADRDPRSMAVGQVMTKNPECLTSADTLGYALHKMSVGSFRHLPLLDDQGLPAGVVSEQEGVRYLVGFFPEELINQPPRSIAQRPPRSQYGG